ncbi:MAG: protein of unknown function DUF3626 [Terrestrivirus sp.]|uniref:Uncharacterized protein n=1 Tax=Terrestrivirus sp. TaxID=2487775 RepID=A0A3G4ZN49_9VIRU|nr:MAG: protein of unknown function DUF3626 [Terrestrivirus sp.]
MYITCQICYNDINHTDYNNHESNCVKEQQKMMEEFKNNKKNHKNIDDKKINEQSMEKKIENELKKLTEKQSRAVETFKKKSRIISRNMRLLVLQRFQQNGFTEDDLDKTMKYIQTIAPLVIHVNINKSLQFLIKDTEYRNQFETKTSGGSLSATSRIDWEKNLFGSIYVDSTAHEKVKYGVVNMLNYPGGVTGAYGYGDSYFILKQSVKTRTSFVQGDSSSKQLHICSFDNCIQILYYIDDVMLTDIIKIALGNIPSSGHVYSYIEAQIHGPIVLAEDIETFVVSNKYKDQHIMGTVGEFCNKNDIKLEFY